MARGPCSRPTHSRTVPADTIGPAARVRRRPGSWFARRPSVAAPLDRADHPVLIGVLTGDDRTVLADERGLVADVGLAGQRRERDESSARCPDRGLVVDTLAGQ